MTDEAGVPQALEHGVVASESPSRGRRRLLFAAGAVLPSVYTLSSGAQAAAVSGMVCLLKEAPPPARFTQDDDYARRPDGWLRAPVSFGEYDGTTANCVTSPQQSCIAFSPAGKSGSPALPSAGGGHTDAESGSVWIVQGNRMTSNPRAPIVNINLGRKHYGLVYVDETGTVATLDPNGAPNLHPTTNSCWASIMGGRISKLG